MPRWLHLQDAELSERVRLAVGPPGPLRRAASVIAHSADGWWCVSVAALLVLFGGPRCQASAAAIAAAFLTSGLVVRVIKITVRRERPPGEWGARQRRMDPHAFPSGHSARATTLALVVGAALGSVWLAAPLGLWAIAVATARVAMGVHYVSDVLAGMMIGLICGLLTIFVFLPPG